MLPNFRQYSLVVWQAWPMAPLTRLRSAMPKLACQQARGLGMVQSVMMRSVRRTVLVLSVFSGLLCAGFVAACAYTKAPRTELNLIETDQYSLWLDSWGAHACFSTRQNGASGVEDIGSIGIYVTARIDAFGSILAVTLPHWLLISGTAILPGVYVGGLRRTLLVRYRRKHGLCLACGYDLRASKDRCPECGTSIPVQTASEKV